MTRVVVVGGGYAGIACLAELRVHLPQARLALVDPSPWHLKRTRLHEAASRPLDELRVPFATLASRLRFEHHLAVAGDGGGFDEDDLLAWSQTGRLSVTTVGEATGQASLTALEFDYLVVTTGARPLLTPPPADEGASRQVLCLDELGHLELREVLRDLAGAARGAAPPRISVVGAGASGVQYAFELAEAMRRLGAPGAVRVLDEAPMPLPEMPQRGREYAAVRMHDAAIEWLPRSRWLGQSGARLRFADAGSGVEQEVDSALTLLLAGVRPQPIDLRANRFGQVQVGGRTLANVLTAGDCATLDAPGSSAATAQIAVRQGKHVAINVSRLRRGRDPMPWVFTEIGYVVSLGVLDAVGWVFSRANVLTGAAAMGIKSLVDAQYDLYLEGIDTYVL